MPGHHCVVEGRNLYAVTHLALARRQKSRTGILGTQTNDKGSHRAAFFYYIESCALDCNKGDILERK